jgi:KDO2-lipid IV(A) lauroyltransferase
MAVKTEKWRVGLGDVIQYALFRMVEALLRLLPLKVCHGLGVGVGTIFWGVSGRYRRLVGRNLRIAGRIEGEDPELPRMVRRTFQLVCANLICGARTATMPVERLRKHVEPEGAEHLERALAGNGSVLLVIPHMGNWELLAQAVRFYAPPGARGGAIYRPLNNPLIDSLVRRRRESEGTVLLSRTDGFHKVCSFLRDGGGIGVLADQRAGHKGVLAPFFGRLSSCSGLPELLARRTGASLVSISLSTIGPGRWRFRFRPIGDSSTTGVMEALATAMSDSLPDVFWLHDRWRVDRRRPLDFYIKRPKVQSFDHVTTPFRVVVSCRGLEVASWAAIEEMLNKRPDLLVELLDGGNLPPFPESDRVRRVSFTPDQSPKHMVQALKRLDAESPTPLDAAILLDGDRRVAEACRKIGLRAVVGVTADPEQRPWTRTVKPAKTEDGWREIALAFGAVPIET